MIREDRVGLKEQVRIELDKMKGTIRSSVVETE